MSDRKEFEASVRATWSDSFLFERGGDGFYVDETLAGMWWGWQANHQSLPSCSEIPNSSDHIADAGEMAGSRQALECEPAMWSLSFNGGPANHFTTYPTKESAEDYISLCEIGEKESDKGRIEVVPLYTHPASADVPDLFWNCGDIDSGDRGIDHVISVIADGMDLSSTDTFPIMRAKRFPDGEVCITVDAERDVEWKWAELEQEQSDDR